jgi:hypothetical protein
MPVQDFVEQVEPREKGEVATLLIQEREIEGPGGLCRWVHFAGSLFMIIAADHALHSLAVVRTSFPSSLIGMFVLLCGLLWLSAVGHEARACALARAFSPAVSWITRWLPLFYVPPLVVVPLALRSMDPLRLVGSNLRSVDACSLLLLADHSYAWTLASGPSVHALGR